MRVFLVNDVSIHREGLTTLLARKPALRVVGGGRSDDACLRAIAAVRPRLILVDGCSIRDAGFIRDAIAASRGGSAVATGILHEASILACAEAGVAGYVADDASIEELCESLQKVTMGQFPCPATIAKVLLRHVGSSDHRRDGHDGFDRRLTARESDIVKLLDRGLTNKEIAVALAIEIATVKNHVHHILEKLGVARRAAAAAKVRANESEDLDPAFRSPLS